MAHATVLIFDDRYESYDVEKKVLADCDAEVINLREPAVDCDPALTARADAVMVNLLPMDAAQIATLKGCRLISRYGVGVDNVDVQAATAAGIWVANVQHYALEDVSDHALALLLGCVRQIVARDREVRDGLWNTAARLKSHRVKDRTLGLVGYGDIARALHRKVSGLGLARVLVSDPFIDKAVIASAGAEPCGLETLIQESDYISVHAPLTEKTRGMIGKAQFARMKPGAIIINTARGPLIDESALADALASGRIAGAGIDVFELEPLPADSPLRKLGNVILNDHAGYYTEESLVQLKTEVAVNVREVLAGKPPVYPVNSVTGTRG